jgi:hypothetical protein
MVLPSLVRLGSQYRLCKDVYGVDALAKWYKYMLCGATQATIAFTQDLGN